MSEAEWEDATNRDRMLAQLGPQLGPERRRLFAAACCRRLVHLFDDPVCRQALEAAEYYSIGSLGEKRLAQAHQAAVAAARRRGGPFNWHLEESRAERACDLAVVAVARAAEPGRTGPSALAWEESASALVLEAQQALGGGMSPVKLRRKWPYLSHTRERALPLVRHHAEAVQCNLLREVVGNPFRSVHFDPAWRKWNGHTLARMARMIFDGNRFDELPVVADMLEDAGCTDKAILAHCRRPGDHVRGCWVLGLLLGRPPLP
jgi:hypothetical protein